MHSGCWLSTEHTTIPTFKWIHAKKILPAIYLVETAWICSQETQKYDCYKDQEMEFNHLPTNVRRLTSHYPWQSKQHNYHIVQCPAFKTKSLEHYGWWRNYKIILIKTPPLSKKCQDALCAVKKNCCLWKPRINRTRTALSPRKIICTLGRAD